MQRRLTHATLALLIPVLLCASLAEMAAADVLRSPWETPPPQLPTAPTSCPQPPNLPTGIVAASYYTDDERSVTDPRRKEEYDNAVDPLRSAARSVSAMADRYRETGGRSEADCALTWLTKFAGDGALTGTMSSNQATYVQGWIMGAFAVAALKIHPALGSSQATLVSEWLAGIADRQISYYEARADKIDGRNNHRYWAGFAVMAAGILSARKDLYNWGEASFRIATTQVTRDGILPLEMKRGARALHYHLFAAAPLVTMAELAEANGANLYAEKDYALSRLVRRALGSIDDPSFFAQKTGIAQEPVRIDAMDVGWAAPYARRFHDSEIAALVARLPSTGFVYLGGKPPGGP